MYSNAMQSRRLAAAFWRMSNQRI